MHTPDFEKPQVLEDVLLVVGPAGQGGKILEMCPGADEPAVCSRLGVDTKDVTRLEVVV